MNSHLKTIVIWLVVIAAVVIGYQIFNQASAHRQQLDESTFYERVRDGQILEVTITGDQVGYKIRGKFKTAVQGPTGQPIKSFTTYVVKDESLLKMLREQGVGITSEEPRDSSFFSMLVVPTSTGWLFACVSTMWSASATYFSRTVR